MSSNGDQVKILLRRFADNQASGEEIIEMFRLLRGEHGDTALESLIMELRGEVTTDPADAAVDWEAVWASIRQKTQRPPIARGMFWMKAAAAVIVIALLSIGSYFYFDPNTTKQLATTNSKSHLKNDVAPGTNRATLTLASGRQIILDSAANGSLAKEGNINVLKLDSGRIAYDAGHSQLTTGNSPLELNTITTPRGGQYQIVLSDGSKVWLNAASSLKYPTAFTGKERKVELTGEGYFEIKHLTPNPSPGGEGDKVTPFIVTVNGMRVEVLGTHFNINAYDDEASIKTTLLEGSVKVSIASPSPLERDGVRLKPGQQAQIENHGNQLIPKIMVQTVDLDEAIAWKNGRFIFQGNNIQSVMRQLSRWYDVEVSYEGEVTDEEFVGVLKRSRYENISQVLEMLEKTRTVSFSVNGRNITVMPYKK